MGKIKNMLIDEMNDDPQAHEHMQRIWEEEWEKHKQEKLIAIKDHYIKIFEHLWMERKDDGLVEDFGLFVANTTPIDTKLWAIIGDYVDNHKKKDDDKR